METFTCPICKAKFKTKQGIDKHICRWFCKHCSKKLLTENGLIKHELNCKFNPKNESKLQNKHNEDIRLQMERAENERIEILRLQNECINNDLFHPNKLIGELVYIVYPIVRKPTHEWKFNRWVRVRYEAVLEFVAVSSIITEIKPSINKYTMLDCLKNKTNLPAIYKLERFPNDTFLESGFYKNMEMALIDSKVKQVNYNKACQDASDCR